MNAVFFNPSIDEATRRQRVYDGHLVVYAATPGSVALIEHAQAMTRDAFGAVDPQMPQVDLPVEEFAVVAAELRAKFTHHPKTTELIRALLDEFGCDLNQTYFSLPPLRTSAPEDYLIPGLAYALPPHRDTWYSAPFNQINWWLPIFPVVPENAIALHPWYWNQPLRNGSHRFGYYAWSRKPTEQQIKSDTVSGPKPEEPIELDRQVRVITEPGGVLLFSGNHLHSSVPNTSGRTRFSMDFRTVNLDDVLARRGALNVDCKCTGTTLWHFVRAADLQPIAEEVAAAYEGWATLTS